MPTFFEKKWTLFMSKFIKISFIIAKFYTKIISIELFHFICEMLDKITLFEFCVK